MRNFNHVDEFLITNFKKGRINLRITDLWQSKFTKDMEPNLLYKTFTKIQIY